MPFSKEFIDVLLAASDEYEESMILDYNTLEEYEPTKMYAVFAKSNIDSPIHKTKIEPFELFLLQHTEPNAWAWQHNDKFVMCIHLSLFKLIEQRVRRKLQTLPEDAHEIISRCSFEEELPVDYLIYQFTTVFTFYHELAHLFQYKKKDEGVAHFERYNLYEGKLFDKLVHAMEIDADIFAAEHITAHVFQFWNASPDEKRTKESLETMISLALLSSFILFFELSQGWQEWYTLDYDHPNPLIRVCYILDALVQTSKTNEHKLNFEIDGKKILQDTFLLANHFIVDDRANGLESFAERFQDHSEEIETYIKREMFPYMDGIAFLNCNDQH
jgi:hypothetical protein